jgi:hypothetical protein
MLAKKAIGLLRGFRRVLPRATQCSSFELALVRCSTLTTGASTRGHAGATRRRRRHLFGQQPRNVRLIAATGIVRQLSQRTQGKT